MKAGPRNFEQYMSSLADHKLFGEKLHIEQDHQSPNLTYNYQSITSTLPLSNSSFEELRVAHVAAVTPNSTQTKATLELAPPLFELKPSITSSNNMTGFGKPSPPRESAFPDHSDSSS
ncbi:hypothetical protein LTS18_006131, partial [Coniosporium uncinatum]